MLEITARDAHAPKFKTFPYNNRRLINPQPTNISKVTSITFSNGVVVSTDMEHYDSEPNRYFPVIWDHDSVNQSTQWLSRSMTETEYGHIYATMPSPVRLRTYRMIGYKGNDTSRGAMTDVSIQAKRIDTGEWITIANVGHLAEGQDTNWIKVSHNFSATEFRLRFRGVLHVSNRYGGLKRLWLYV